MTKATRTHGSTAYWTKIDDRRTRLRDLGRRIDTPQDFHILGGGVAGLAAAIEILSLRRPGGPRHSVTVYEASNRLGGRINTKRLGEKPRNGPDTRPTFERGAMRIPTSHDYTWAYAREGGLRRRRFLNDDRSHDFRNGVFRPVNPTTLRRLATTYGVRDPEVDRGPGHLFGKNVLGPEMNELDEFYRDRGGRAYWAPRLLDGQIIDTGLRRIDQLSLEQVLRQRLAHDPGQTKFLEDLLFPGLTDRAILMFVISRLTNTGGPWELCKEFEDGTVTGGMDLLVDGMAKRIRDLEPGAIQLNSMVRSITTDPRGDWRVALADGRVIDRGGRRNRHLLCALPFSIFQNGDVELRGFETAKLDAIRGLTYVDATKVALHVRERFWERMPEPGIRGGRSLTDRASTSSYYPNDQSEVVDIPPRILDAAHADYDLYTQPLRTESAAEIEARAAEETRPGPWLMLSSYTFGPRAREMGGRPPLSTVTDLQRVFPDVDRFVVPEESETWQWSRQPLARGAFALPAPGIVSRHYRAARAPHRGVFFAGDHISPEPGWIQGSLFSSLYALEDVLRSAAGGRASEETVEPVAVETVEPVAVES